MSLNDIARELDLDIATLANYVREGMPTTSSEAAAKWLEHQTVADVPDQASDANNLYKSIKELALAERYMLENMLKRGEVVSWESVRRTWIKLIQEAQSQVTTLPTRLIRLVHFPNTEAANEALKELQHITDGVLRTLQSGTDRDEYNFNSPLDNKAILNHDLQNLPEEN